MLRETTSRGLCELVCPSRTSERGGEGYCVKEGGGEEGERERERPGEVRLHYVRAEGGILSSARSKNFRGTKAYPSVDTETELDSKFRVFGSVFVTAFDVLVCTVWRVIVLSCKITSAYRICL